MSLEQKFTAVEKVLQFHHSTSRSPLTYDSLALRVFQSGGLVLKREDLDAVNGAVPGAYQLSCIGSTQYVEAAGLPHDMEERRRRFASRKLTPSRKTVSLSGPATRSFSVVGAPLKREIVKGKITKSSTAARVSSVPSLGVLQQRILAKQALPNRAAALREQQQKFLLAQLPAIAQILSSLSTASRSYTLSELVDKLGHSLPTKLSAAELGQAITLLAARMPSVCSLVPAGQLTVVKVHGRIQQPSLVK